MLKRLKIVGLCLLAAFAFSAVAVSPAFAASEINPQWWVAEKALSANHTIEAEANLAQELITEKTIVTAEITLTCTGYSVSEAEIIPGKVATPGSRSEERRVGKECR